MDIKSQSDCHDEYNSVVKKLLKAHKPICHMLISACKRVILHEHLYPFSNIQLFRKNLVGIYLDIFALEFLMAVSNAYETQRQREVDRDQGRGNRYIYK